MTFPIGKWSFSAGEISPSLWGRPDQPKFQNGASVMRNCYVNFRGGVLSRAGTAFVGQCLQPGEGGSFPPPRIIEFQFSTSQSYVLEFGDQYLRFASNGSYITEATISITGASKANPCVLTVPGNPWVLNDWIFVTGIAGMTELNNRFFIVSGVPGFGQVSISDTFGNPVDSSLFAAYVSGGTAARIYTIATPYFARDLPYLKFSQSADVMSLTCVNQVSGVEYPPYDLARISGNNWTLTQTSFGSAIAAPTGTTATAANTTASNPTSYAYVVTAVDSITGQESVASGVANVVDSVNISTVLGSITVAWNAVNGASYYNIYKAQPAAYGASVPIGSLFGLAGQSYGTQWVDSNVIPDFTVVPPLHFNPFARGQVLSCTSVSGGSGYAQASTTAVLTSGTASGVVLQPVVVGDAVVAIIVVNPGENAGPLDTITVSGAGTGAVFNPVIGPQSGTYPGVVGYFQQRRVYAYTLNNPDTYFMSQTGAYTNMDSATPPIDSDAIIGSPWASQVNGIQWLQPMPNGLIVGTGLDAWQLYGAGGPGSPITPSSQNAQPQESNGFSATLPPIKVNYDVLYAQSLGTVVRDFQYNFFVNIYAGTDISLASSHLFASYQLREWAWAREPDKIVWTARNDGKFLSLTYLKEQDQAIIGWARHDTNGQVRSVAQASEPPVNAVYFVVRRYIQGAGKWFYYLERMDSRQWFGPEDPWCVDCGLSLPQPHPDAGLQADTADGTAQLTNGRVVFGGSGYTAPAGIITDPTGHGTGAAFTGFTVAGGVITGFTFNPGSGYQAYQVALIDPTGTGAVIAFDIVSTVTFTTTGNSVFTADNVGDVIRYGGGIATITEYVSGTVVNATLTTVIANVIADDPTNLPHPAGSGKWSMTTPVTVLTNLGHLEGMEVAILADGSPQANQVVANGQITLSSPASSIVVGLPFVVQLQSMHTDIPGAPTIQGKRKVISSVTVRMQGSTGVTLGANQPVASTLDFQQEIPWTDMEASGSRPNAVTAGAPVPLFTGDVQLSIRDDWNFQNVGNDGNQASPGMIAAQQLYPLPMSIVAFIAEIEVGDG